MVVSLGGKGLGYSGVIGFLAGRGSGYSVVVSSLGGRDGPSIACYSSSSAFFRCNSFSSAFLSASTMAFSSGDTNIVGSNLTNGTFF